MPVTTETLHAFDRHAPGYAEGWGKDPLARVLRARVLAVCENYFPSNGHIVDLGCGVGLDAEALEASGRRVTAVDASPGMTREARGRVDDVRTCDLDALHTLEVDAPFDGALSNFGALNCLPSLDNFGRSLGRLLRPGAHAVLVVIGAWCPVEDFALLARGRRPRRGRTRVTLEGIELGVRYLTASAVEAALPDYTPLHREALGAFVAPPDLGGRPGLRSRLEPHFARLPLVRAAGDHTLLVLRRR